MLPAAALGMALRSAGEQFTFAGSTVYGRLRSEDVERISAEGDRYTVGVELLTLAVGDFPALAVESVITRVAGGTYRVVDIQNRADGLRKNVIVVAVP